MRKVADLPMDASYCTVESSVGVVEDKGRSGVEHHRRGLPKNCSVSPSLAVVAAGVHELLECPVCTNLMCPPIYQCSNGHTLCSTCKSRVQNRCPACRQELGDIRCLALEKVAESLDLPCKYSSVGCPQMFPYFCKTKHESICSFRPYRCPYVGSDCRIIGDIPSLVSHLRDEHKVDMHTGCTFKHRYVKSNPKEVENASWMLTRNMALFFSGGDSKELKLRVTGRIWREEQNSNAECAVERTFKQST